MSGEDGLSLPQYGLSVKEGAVAKDGIERVSVQREPLGSGLPFLFSVFPDLRASACIRGSRPFLFSSALSAPLR